ncbi:hypothetical protein [Streptomyces rhizosphaericus]|uniref:Transposase Helix-turn-helix domain-containing protein n=1 Tax=Streptomyces rhizosphaericus TaxID=114699 RepID=A0ABN1R1W5_9ACTN|nr:hypothetical protein [Streptomyces cangkringensis]
MSENQRLRVTTGVTYTAVLDFSRETVLCLARLLEAERRARGTRRATRRLGPFKQAVLVLRRLLDNTRIAQLAADNGISGRAATATSWRGSPYSTPRARRWRRPSRARKRPATRT